MAFDAGRAAQRIHECAIAYQAHLLDRRTLFIPSDGSIPFECVFLSDNFQHLCGVNYATDITKPVFFDRAVKDRIKPELLIPVHGQRTIMKLNSLPILCRIDTKANAAVRDPVDHQGTYADLFCSNMEACIGFVKTGGVYRPKTALAHNPSRSEPGYVNILAIVKTEPDGLVYSLVSKEPKRRNITGEKVRRILASLNRYDGGCDVMPAVEHFRELL
ncbi:PBECR4 domain-containing protein [Bifidobacterium felsineum]|uniref:PBECR4 domain-containing protein n=1 Tax=Bifidobacterium felsineum TaxID=2045440 RepID=UPI001BDBED61|nr:PBECR4 domain-containing protein [Bifidobacterium felsineum]MBT1164631.1 hypothetical protein [Bifidobacterium felsineum]